MDGSLAAKDKVVRDNKEAEKNIENREPENLFIMLDLCVSRMFSARLLLKLVATELYSEEGYKAN